VLLCANFALAATPAELLTAYRQAAASEPSAERGARFYARNFGVSAKMPACTSCHTEQATRAGQHAVTGKPIAPLSPLANGERFTDAAKAEKWFRRNCTEVVGRECSAAEKADLLSFLMKGN
jgi:hypothetical protein